MKVLSNVCLLRVRNTSGNTENSYESFVKCVCHRYMLQRQGSTPTRVETLVDLPSAPLKALSNVCLLRLIAQRVTFTRLGKSTFGNARNL